MRNRFSPPLGTPSYLSIRISLTALVVILAVIPVLTLAFVMIHEVDQNARAQARNQMESLAESKSLDVSRWIDNAQTTLHLMATDPAEIYAIQRVFVEDNTLEDEGKLRQFMSDRLQRQSDYSEFFLYDLSGEILVSTSDMQEGKIVRNQPYFDSSLHTDYVQPPFFDIPFMRVDMIVTELIPDAKGQALGILAGRLNIDTLSKIMLPRVGLGQTGETYLVSLESNYLVTPSRFEGFPLTRSYHSEGIDRVLAGEDGAGTYPGYRGVAVIGAYRWLPDVQLGLLAEMSESEALQTGSRLRTLGLAGAAGLIIVATGIGLLAAHYLAQPLIALTETANKIAAGDYSQRSQVRSRNEIGRLAAVFNAMTDELSRNIAELNATLEELRLSEDRYRQLAEELEGRVQARTAELENANRELDSFAYSVSHDLRAPLRTIVGFSQAVMEDYEDLLDDEGQDFLHKIVAGGNRMNDLIGDLLQLSRVTRSALSCQQIDLSALAQSVFEDLQAADSNRRVRWRVQPEMNAFADEHLMRVVLTNLLGNAWKFTGHTDDAEIDFFTQEQDGQTVYVVRDNGAGFEMAYVDKLFSAFQRLHREDEFEGTGIGLATARRIISKHRGRIWAEAEVGQGATFFFTLNAAHVGQLNGDTSLESPVV